MKSFSAMSKGCPPQKASAPGQTETPQTHQVKAACGGDLKKVKKVVKLVGFVNSESTFIDQPKVSIFYFSLSFSLSL